MLFGHLWNKKQGLGRDPNIEQGQSRDHALFHANRQTNYRTKTDMNLHKAKTGQMNEGIKSNKGIIWLFIEENLF